MPANIVGVDVGGTFTDVALLVNGELVTAKVPSTDEQSDGVIAGIEKACVRMQASSRATSRSSRTQ
jgi:N-methylhydantoinase A